MKEYGIHTTYDNYAEPFAVRDADGTILVECSSIQEADDIAMAVVRQRQLDDGAESVGDGSYEPIEWPRF